MNQTNLKTDPTFEWHVVNHEGDFASCPDPACHDIRIKTISAWLDELAEVRHAMTTTTQEIEEKRAAILATVKGDLDALEASYSDLIKAAVEYGEMMEAQIKELVSAGEETVKGKSLQAVYSKPRPKWNTAKLEGYATAHPEIRAFCKAGKPSVSIRANGSKGEEDGQQDV